MKTPLPVMKKQCPTCPFREDGNGYTQVRGLLVSRAIDIDTAGSPECHSTGESDVTHKKIHKAPHVCRGARDLQLKLFAAIGFIEEATDAAWFKKAREMGYEC
jgi:hypothetical protein